MLGSRPTARKALLLRIPVLTLLFVGVSFEIWAIGPAQFQSIILWPRPERSLECFFLPWGLFGTGGFFVFFRNVIVGQFGCSAATGRPVWSEFYPYIAQTLFLTIITILVWSAVGVLLATRRWRRDSTSVSSTIARSSCWYALLAGMMPATIFAWISLGLPISYDGPTEWVWGLPARSNPLYWPLPVLVIGLALVSVPVNLGILARDSRSNEDSPRSMRHRLLLPLARTNFAVLLSAVVLAEAFTALTGRGRYGIGALLSTSVGWRDTTMLMAIFYLLFVAVMVGNYGIDLFAARLGLSTVEDSFASGNDFLPNFPRKQLQTTRPFSIARPSTASATIFVFLGFALLTSQFAQSGDNFWPDVLSGIQPAFLSASGPALLTTLLGVGLCSCFRKGLEEKAQASSST